MVYAMPKKYLLNVNGNFVIPLIRIRSVLLLVLSNINKGCNKSVYCFHNSTAVPLYVFKDNEDCV